MSELVDRIIVEEALGDVPWKEMREMLKRVVKRVVVEVYGGEEKECRDVICKLDEFSDSAPFTIKKVLEAVGEVVEENVDNGQYKCRIRQIGEEGVEEYEVESDYYVQRKVPSRSCLYVERIFKLVNVESSLDDVSICGGGDEDEGVRIVQMDKIEM